MKNRNLVIDSDLNKVSDILADVPGIRELSKDKDLKKHQTIALSMESL